MNEKGYMEVDFKEKILKIPKQEEDYRSTQQVWRLVADVWAR